MSVTAIVLAGSRPGVDAFAASLGTDLKALIPVAGKPMVCRPVRALLGSKAVGRVLVLTQDPPRLEQVLPKDSRVAVAASGRTIAATLEAFCFDPATEWPLLVTTADHALLTSQMVDQFCSAAQGSDLAIGMVERQSLLDRLPQTRRTWYRLRGGAYTGANLFLLGSPKVAAALELWRSVEQDRKKGWRVLLALGPGTLFAAALRLITIEALLRRMGRRLGIEARPVVLSDPLAGVDVDKAEDRELAEAILAGRA